MPPVGTSTTSPTSVVVLLLLLLLLPLVVLPVRSLELVLWLLGALVVDGFGDGGLGVVVMATAEVKPPTTHAPTVECNVPLQTKIPVV